MNVFDTENEIMAGTAPLGREVSAAAGPQDWQEHITVLADMSTGAWMADFQTIGFDITEEMRPWSYAQIYDADGDANEASTPPAPPTPHIEAFAWLDRYSLVDWPEGVPVEVAIEDPDYQAETFVPDGSSSSYDFFPGVDLQPGSTITATNGDITKVLVISPLHATTVNPDTGLVTGVATPNVSFGMKTDGDHFQLPIEQGVTADPVGNWSVTIDSYLPWVWFTRGEMWESDADGDVTYAIWHVHNEILEVWLAQNELRADDWPVDTELTFTVYDPATGLTHEYFAQTERQAWLESTWAIVNPGDLQLMPGMTVTVTDGTTTTSTVIQDIEISQADTDNDLVSGHAPPAASLELYSSEDSPLLRFFNAGEDGTWAIDYREPSLNGATVDVNPGDNFWLFLREEDKDSTVYSWNVPNPRIVHRYQRYLVAEQFTPGALVNFSIYESQGSTDPLFEMSRTADDAGAVNIQVWEYPIDLAPGNYMVVSDGTTTKDLVLEPITMNVFDATADILSGVTVPGEYVYIWVANESTYCNTELTASDSGAWAADFSAQPCDITGDMNAAAMVFDEDGDVSEAGPPAPPQGYHDYDTGDVPSWACNAGGWAMDPDSPYEDVNIRVLVDGTSVVETQAANYREDLEVSWNEGGGGCPGGHCAFEVNLWNYMSHYVKHNVTVEAQDLQTAEWYPLNSTPKTLTCRTYDIYTYDPFTGKTKPITNLMDQDEYNPDWSPNGKKIAHDVVDADGQLGIYITDLKTHVSTPLMGAQDGGNDAVWSPNGKWIVFDRQWNGNPNLYLVSSWGGLSTLVRSNAISPGWAPNGKRLVFQQPSDGSIRTIAVMGGTGGETVVAASGANPVWSPNGKWIAYEDDGDIWKVQVNSKGIAVGEPIQVTSLVAQDGQPTWSADSKTIVFHSGLSDDLDLWKVSAAGGVPTWLTGAPEFGDYDPDYARNNSRIAYASFSPDGQAARTWISAYSYDLPAGTLSEGTYPYHFEFEWNLPEPDAFSGQAGEFIISNGAPMYDGNVLLRGVAELRGVETPEGLICEGIEEINPDQSMRFLIGWVPGVDEFIPMTYAEAKAHFKSVTARAVWGDGMSASLVPHEIFPWTSPVDWPAYVCTYTR